MYIDYVVDDIHHLCSSGLPILDKTTIKNEVKLRFGIFRNGKSIFTKDFSDTIYKKSCANERIYTFYVIEALNIINKDSFNYLVHEYCEQRIIEKDTEHWVMYLALKATREKLTSMSSNVLRCILLSLIKVEYPTNTSVSLDRMHSYVEIAREEAYKYGYTRSVDEICDLYLHEIDSLFHKLENM